MSLIHQAYAQNSDTNASSLSVTCNLSSTYSGAIGLVAIVQGADSSSSDLSIETSGGVSWSGGGGEAFTCAYEYMTSAYLMTSIWYLADPTIADGTVTVTPGGKSTDLSCVVAIVYGSGSGSTMAYDTYGTDSGTGPDTLLVSIAAQAGSLIYGGVLMDYGSGEYITPVSPTLDLYEFDYGSEIAAAGYCWDFSGYCDLGYWCNMTSVGVWLNAATFYDSNSPPTTALSNPTDTAEVSDTTPTLTFTGTDADSDEVEYQVQVDTAATFDSAIPTSSGTTLGTAATDRANTFTSNRTIITAPVSTVAGRIDTVEVWLATTSPTNNKIGTFYNTGGSTWACRDYVAVGSITGGSRQTFNNLALEVQVGDQLGIFNAFGTMECDWSGGSDIYVYQGDGTSSSQTYSTSAGYEISLYAPDVLLLWPLLDADSTTDTGFLKSGDTHPFTEGESCTYTVNYRDYLLDVYNGSQDSFYPSYSGAPGQEAAQSFAGDGSDLTSVKFLLTKLGLPTGSVYARLYEHTGTFGGSSTPTGSAVATSNAVDVSTISGASYEWVEFTFSTPYTLSSSYYFISVGYNSGDSSNNLRVAVDNTSPSHEGSAASYNGSSWTYQSNNDLPFYVYVEDSSYELPDSDTYYWHVRAKDPSGTNEWGAWSSTWSFDVSAGVEEDTGSGTATLQPLEVTAAGVTAELDTGSGTPTLQPLEVVASATVTENASGVATFQPFEVAAAGTVTENASGVATLQPLEVAAEGYSAYYGSGTPTLAALEVAAAGTVTESGSGVATLQPLEVAAAAESYYYASGSATIPALTVSATADAVESGTGTATLPAVQVVASGQVTESGSGIATLQPLEVAAAATSQEIVTASGVATLQPLEAANGAATVTENGSGVATLQPVEVAAEGYTAYYGSGTATLAPVEVAAAGTITESGSGTATLAALTVTAAGTVTETGEGITNLNPFEVVAQGVVTEFGAGIATLPSLEVSGAATVAENASGTATLQPFEVAAAGYTAYYASGTATLSALTVAAAATVTEYGAGVATLQPIEVVATGGSGFWASGVATLQPIEVVASGTVTENAAGVATLPALTVTAEGTAGTGSTGSGIATLAPLTAAASGTVTENGSAVATLQPLEVAASGTVTEVGAGVSNLCPFEVAAAGVVTESGSGIATLQPLEVAATGYTAYYGSGTATLPAVEAAAAGVVTESGSGVATLQAITVTAEGTTAYYGTGTPALPALAVTAAGTVTEFGSGIATLAPMEVAAAGVHGAFILEANQVGDNIVVTW